MELPGACLSQVLYGADREARRSRTRNDDSHAELRGIPVYAEPVMTFVEAHDSAKSQCSEQSKFRATT